MPNQIVFKVFFLNDKGLELSAAGVSDISTEHTVLKECLINVDQVESAQPSLRHRNSTVLVMISGDEFTVNISVKDYLALVDHVVANKVLCRLKN